MKNQALTVIILAAILILLWVYRSSKSTYALRPMGVRVNGPSEKSIFDLPYKLECVPGPQATASYYTKDLSPGGICGAQEFVVSQSEYEIVDGICGSILD